MKKKVYTIKPTKKQIAIMTLYWEAFQTEQENLWGRMSELEKEMSRETGIKNLEFFFCDNDCVGIGNADRTMSLIDAEKLVSDKNAERAKKHIESL